MAGFAVACLMPQQARAQSAATVTGPVSVNVSPGDPSNDFIFSMSGMDLASHGYIEEEFFLEGTANRYSQSEMETADIVDGGHAYKTRFVVRRPADAARFNGTVVVEWVNVTANRDLDIDWLQVGEHLMRNGYAWIGLSAQRVGVDQMREWSPTRYGSLDWRIPQIVASMPEEEAISWNWRLTDWYLFFGFLDRHFDVILAGELTDSTWTDAGNLVFTGTLARHLGFTAHPKYLEVAEATGIIDVWEKRGPPDFCEKVSGKWVCE